MPRRQGAAAAALGGGDIRGIQFLRAIAALMVVAHHARHYFPEGEHWTAFGSRGVDIFFVISGFIMAHTTRAFDPSASRTAQAADFLKRRFLRVVPLYWLALLWTAKRQLAAGEGVPDLLRDLVFVPHFHAVYTDSVFPALVPGWTINYEMFFYALFALSLLVGRMRHVVLCAALALLVVAGALAAPASAAGIFYTHSIVLEFAFGIAVYACLRRWPRPLATPLAVAASIVAVLLLAIENDDRWRGLLDGPCAALLVWSFVQWTGALRLRWLHALGDASYSIYLFHLATFAVSGWALHRAGIAAVTPLHVAVAIAVQMAVAIAGGLAVHVLVERPFLRAVGTRGPVVARS